MANVALEGPGVVAVVSANLTVHLSNLGLSVWLSVQPVDLASQLSC